MAEREKYLLVEKFADIAAPTLVVWGSNPTGIALEYGEMAAARMPNARLAVIEGGSHSAQGIRPRDFEREVVAFLSEPV